MAGEGLDREEHSRGRPQTVEHNPGEEQSKLGTDWDGD